MTITVRRSSHVVAMLLAALVPLAACADDVDCDEELGEVFSNGLCLPLGDTDPEPMQPAVDAGGDGGGVAECGPDAPSFGDPCTDGDGHTDCGCDAPICAIQPGQAEGFCTMIDCDDRAAPCPSGWTCTDLSSIDPSYPPTCLPDG